MLIAACSSGLSPQSVRSVGAVQNAALMPTNSAPDAVSFDPTNTAPQQRIILKNASLSLTVESPAKTVAQIAQLAASSNGWVVASNVIAPGPGNGAATATISIRVPADKLTAIVDQIKVGVVSVDNENISGEDVTQKYVDLNSQLTNLQNTAAQLQKVMSSATNVKDILSVQDQLTTTQGQIEQIKGQVQYFSQAAAYSLISVALVQKQAIVSATPTPVAPLGLANWQPGQTVYDAANALVLLAQSMVTLVIWLIILGIPVGVLVLIGLWIRRKLPAAWFVRGAIIRPLPYTAAIDSTNTRPPPTVS